MTGLPEAAAQITDLGFRMQQLAMEHKDWTVEPNQLRNWSILDKDGKQVGHIDCIWGDLEIYD